MAHINYVRRINNKSVFDICDAINSQPPLTSFAAFCGSSRDRENIALAVIAHNFKNCGVLILHDDQAFENRIGEIYDLAQTKTPIFAANRIGCYSYDPLYGLDDNSVLDSIIPYEPGGAAAPTFMQNRSALLDYLKIMQWQYQLDPRLFGDSPYNLDLLFALTQMSFTELNERVLSYMPASIAKPIRGHLSTQGLQQSVCDAVASFAAMMKSMIWKQHIQWSEHTRLSAVTAIRKKETISIRVPGSDPHLLDYLSKEIHALQREKIAFFLVCYNVRISGVRVIENLMSNLHQDCSIGVVGQTIQSVVAEDKVRVLIENMDQMIVFPCRSASEAEVFTSSFGSYYRVIRPYHNQRSRRLFHFIPDISRGVGYQENETRNIRPEELMSGKIFVAERNTSNPILVDQLRY